MAYKNKEDRNRQAMIIKQECIRCHSTCEWLDTNNEPMVVNGLCNSCRLQENVMAKQAREQRELNNQIYNDRN